MLVGRRAKVGMGCGVWGGWGGVGHNSSWLPFYEYVLFSPDDFSGSLSLSETCFPGLKQLKGREPSCRYPPPNMTHEVRDPVPLGPLGPKGNRSSRYPTDVSIRTVRDEDDYDDGGDDNYLKLIMMVGDNYHHSILCIPSNVLRRKPFGAKF